MCEGRGVTKLHAEDVGGMGWVYKDRPNKECFEQSRACILAPPQLRELIALQSRVARMCVGVV